jgi:tellurite resistance protein TerC
MLVLDLGVFHRKAHVVRFREALATSMVWIGMAVAFNIGVWWWFGPTKALEFTTGYLIEEALSVDNIFVFIVVFAYFRVPKEHQHRVLFWGILGALVMRGAFILAGVALIRSFHWVIYVFGGILVLTGITMLVQRDKEIQPQKNPLLRLFKRFVPSVHEYHGARFWIVQNGKWYATPLLAVLVVVEATDLIFAVDSIPAVFAVTTDPFIVYTSNIFAILGLRSMYFLLAGVMDKFRYLKVGLALVLVFVGVKMCVADMYPIPIAASLSVVAGLLGMSVIASLLAARAEQKGY